MNNWLKLFTDWYFGLYQKIFSALLSFIHDFALWLAYSITDAIATGIAAIPVPAFLAAGLDLSSLLSVFPPFALYVLAKMHIAQLIAVLSAGIGFRLIRKLFTLGQW